MLWKVLKIKTLTLNLHHNHRITINRQTIWIFASLRISNSSLLPRAPSFVTKEYITRNLIDAHSWNSCKSLVNQEPNSSYRSQKEDFNGLECIVEQTFIWTRQIRLDWKVLGPSKRQMIALFMLFLIFPTSLAYNIWFF